MISIRRISERDAALLREVRLRALSDSPMAFGSTYARELAFDCGEWQARASWLSSSPDAATFFAFDENAACGIIGCFRTRDRPDSGTVVSMWVAPEARRKSVGSALMRAIEQSARDNGMWQLRLSAVESNAPAIAFYEKCGFQFTGETEPYPNAPNVRELYMVKAL